MTTEQEKISTPVTKMLNKHVSVRHYTDEPISDEMLRAILNAARRSPTSSNVQAYTFIVVRNPQTKQQLAELGGNQKYIASCPVFLLICADVNRLNIASAMHDKKLILNLENMLVASVDAALAGMSVMTAAESFGLGAVMIGGMRNHPQEVAKLMQFPQGVYVVFGMCLGWPDMEKYPPQKPRLPEDLIIHYEQYDTSDPREKLHAHDAELAEHYRSLGRNLDEAAWTGVMADKFSQPRRAHLRAALEEMGFFFD